MINKKLIATFIICTCVLSGCAGTSPTPDESQEVQVNNEQTTVETEITSEISTEAVAEAMDYSRLFKDLEIAKREKGKDEANPVMTQTYGADPYAMEYDGRLYIYMTADAYEYDNTLKIKENSYGKINTIRVISTNDMVNFTDHGSIKVAGNQGAAKWAHNSWAPAAAWKMIDGKPKFFLYFADAGGGIGVLQSDSPVGPFEDPLGYGLITRETPTCADITWLFDPAVLVDDDGKAYIYFGGGVPEGKEANPGNARVAQLGDDMISIKGTPKLIDAPYLFEDSGIHKYGNKYYYTYCTNWQVDQAGTDKYGFVNAEIACMESNSPMGPFKYKETILENPGKQFGLYGNNHHCVFEFNNKWYITYHTRQLEKIRDIEKGYRCTHINSVNIKDDGTIGYITQNLKGCKQLKYVNPYEINSAANMTEAGGNITFIGSDSLSNYNGCGNMAVKAQSGGFIHVRGVDFEKKTPKKFKATLKKTGDIDESCVIELRTTSLNGNVLGYLPVGKLMAEKDNADTDFLEYEIELTDTPEGVKDLFLTFSGEGYAIDTWTFTEIDDWYPEVIKESLISTGTNNRLEKVITKLENGEDISIAFIGGSVTEGAGASDITESYADRVATDIQNKYPDSNITYINAGLGGTPSALGVMRYERDVINKLGQKPDIVFIEFAVNDYQEETDGRAYESLVRDILESNKNTAVILNFAVFKSHWNMQDTYIPVGELYGLPMVSVKNTVDMAYEKEKLNDKEYFSDEYHPTSYGHKIMADCIAYLFEQVETKDRDLDIAALPEETEKGLDFQNIKLVTAKDAKGAKITKGDFNAKDTQVHAFMRNGELAFADNWMYDGSGSNKEFSIKLNCKNILLNFKQSGNMEEFGTAVILIDGEPVREINAYTQGGWNQSIVALILDEEETKTHVMTIKMKDGDENKKFTILGIAYTD